MNKKSQVKSLAVKCSHCNGTGIVTLNGRYADTWKMLNRYTRPITGAELAREMYVAHTAMCNRLVVLEKLGLADGERYGRERRWMALHKNDE